MKTTAGKLLEILHPKVLKTPSSASSTLRVSDTEGIQLAFRKAVQLIFEEAFRVSGIPSQSLFAATEIIDGKRFREALSKVQDSSWETLGFKPEHLRMLNNLVLSLSTVLVLRPTLRIYVYLRHCFVP